MTVAYHTSTCSENASSNHSEIPDAILGSSHSVKKRKLSGREFYESLGSPKMILAPMVDRSDFAWRMLTRSFMDPKPTNPLLAYSPMFHTRLFNESHAFRLHHFEPLRTKTETIDSSSSWESGIPYLDGNPSIDRPLFVQFCANDPDELLQAGRQVEPFCDAIDLNLGCPQGIAKRGHYGAFLQEDPDLIYKLINKLHNELSIPVTAKFRILETKEKTLEYAKMILSAGASFIAVHGRRREQKGHNTGLADWSYIRYLRDNLPPGTVIFANGNILNHDDINACLEATGADGVMSAEANLSDPTIFSQPPPVGREGREYWRGWDGKGGYRLDFILRRYMDIIYKYVLELPPPERKPLFLPSDLIPDDVDSAPIPSTPEAGDDGPPKKKRKRGKEQKATSPNLVSMQGHLFQLLRPLVSKHTNIRDALARCRAGDLAAFENIVSLVDNAVRMGIQEYDAYPERFGELQESSGHVESLSGSRATIAKYKRPWWVCQPYVRPLPEEALQNGALQPKKKAIANEDGKSDLRRNTSVAPDLKVSSAVNAIGKENAVMYSDELVSG